MVAEGDDPAVVADEIARQVELQERSTKAINGMTAVTATAKIAQQGQQIALSLAWIAKEGLVYQVLGATTPNRWAEYRPTFEQTAATFRQPTAAELAEVRENRLRLVDAKKGETLGGVAKRSSSQWSPAQMSVANAIEASLKLSGGEAIKVSKRERYEPKPVNPTDGR